MNINLTIRRKWVTIIFLLAVVAVSIWVVPQVIIKREVSDSAVAFTCWMDHLDEGGDPIIKSCMGGTASSRHDYSTHPNDKPGDFYAIVNGVTLDDFLRSKFLEARFVAYKKNASADSDINSYDTSRGEFPLLNVRLSELRANFNVTTQY